MKILWICPFFLHPTDRGAQIRTLGMLKQLRKRHEIHFIALNNRQNREGLLRSVEYSSRYFSVEHTAPKRNSICIVPQLAVSFVHPLPMAVFRYSSRKLRQTIDALVSSEHYDSIVCDFLFSAKNLTDLSKCVLLQHDVVTTIWQRHVERNSNPIKKLFFKAQLAKMRAYEGKICRAVKHVVAVSEIDASKLKRMYGIRKVSSISTGVDTKYFSPRRGDFPVSDLVFCGSMDSLPNVDAVEYFVSEVFPLIRDQLPNATFAIAGRSPDARVLKAVEGLTGVTVSGTVEDIRPYLWGAKISIVPIRIGSGTRLKIYECMAAGVPVVSTTVGAEGLRYHDGADIVIADDPPDLASACVRLLLDDAARHKLARKALEYARSDLSWEAVSGELEAILESQRLLPT